MYESYWKDINFNIEHTDFKEEIDTLIIGSGMTGIMCAYELSKNNKDVVIVERNKICSDVSAKTTAKITPLHNLIYQEIAKIHGYEKAYRYFKSQENAMNHIVKIINDEKINCDLKKVDNYMYAMSKAGEKKLLKEYNILKNLGIDVSMCNTIPLPYEVMCAIKYEDNYTFHPLKYLKAIVNILNDRNVSILENYNAVSFERIDDKYIVYFSNGKKIIAHRVIVATHYPIFNPFNLYFSKLYQEKNYLIAFKSDKIIKDIFINTDNPVRSFRGHSGINFLVGNSHKAGDNINYKTYHQNLEKEVYQFDKKAKILNIWTNQDVMSIDYLPFIGKYAKSTPNMYVATAFHTWGMTNSHVAAILIKDLILKKDNNEETLYNPLRITHLNSLGESFKLIGKAINGLLLSRLGKKSLLKNIKTDNGAIVKYKNKSYAIFNQDNKKYIILKPNCSHTYCFLQWNNEEKTWDCKCHGSRFDIYGKVITGPATKPLKQINKL